MRLPGLVVALSLLAASSLASGQRGFEVRDLATMDRYGSPAVASDGSAMVYTRRVVDFDANKVSTSLWIQRPVGEGQPRQLSPSGWNVHSPGISDDGKTVWFLSSKHGSAQLYAQRASGGAPQALTAFARGITSYRVSPDGRRVAFSVDTFADCGADFACTQDRLDHQDEGPTTGVVYDNLFIRHWDSWKDGRRSRLFVADLNPGRSVRKATAISQSLDGDIPAKPFGGADDYAWSPDGKSIVASVKVAGKAEAWSTDFDLYRLDPAGKADPVNLTMDNAALDTGPVFSPDGKTLFYRAMKRPGFEADRLHVMALDLASGEHREIAPDWDRSANGLHVSRDGALLYTTAQDVGQQPLFSIRVADGEVTRLVGGGTFGSLQLAGDQLVFSRNSLQSGDQLMRANLDGSELSALTPAAADMLDDVVFGDFEQFTFNGWNDALVHGYLVKPWNFEEGGNYPVVFLIHGGPQGSFSNSWSYRWNPQTYAGQGYAVVMVDFHGSTGYGQEFTDAISQHWGDRPLEDLQKGWAAALQQYDFLDADRACALGASYGGYMVNWIAGNWNGPWQCFVNHDGVFDTRAMGYVTEELWFTEWENGGTPWDRPQAYEEFNPVNHVGNWRVPMLVIQGDRDYRVPTGQSIATFTALQRRGIDSQLLFFPDENHWVLQPHNSVLWHDTVNAWLKRYIGQ